MAAFKKNERKQAADRCTTELETVQDVVCTAQRAPFTIKLEIIFKVLFAP